MFVDSRKQEVCSTKVSFMLSCMQAEIFPRFRILTFGLLYFRSAQFSNLIRDLCLLAKFRRVMSVSFCVGFFQKILAWANLSEKAH